LTRGSRLPNPGDTEKLLQSCAFKGLCLDLKAISGIKTSGLDENLLWIRDQIQECMRILAECHAHAYHQGGKEKDYFHGSVKNKNTLCFPVSGLFRKLG
jgi:hypothetical protein